MIDDSKLPPIPQDGERGPQVCASVRLYLAILDDLPPEQARLILRHVQSCRGCTEERRLLNRASRLVASLNQTSPSARVDQAVQAAIAARRGSAASISTLERPKLVRVLPEPQRPPVRRPRRSAWIASALAAAAVLLLAVFAGVHFLGGSSGGAQAFVLPGNLSWSGYVVYHMETRMGRDGKPYQVETYHNLGTGYMHVETMRSGQLDVVAVGNDQQMLGLDMMHRVAQWHADDWAVVDDSMFNLTQLRSDLKAGRAVYLGRTRYNNQDVYRIRCSNGMVLLLDMQYHPVNVLDNSSKGAPMYDDFRLLPVSKVPGDMWSMDMPAGFSMGNLPPQP
jgi:hypothetical protein